VSGRGTVELTHVSLSVYILRTAWALKRGFVTAKAARADVHRAANSILRMAVEGRLCLCLRPPGFTSNHGRRSNLNIIAISLRLAFAALHLLFLSVRFLNVDKVTSIDSLTPWKVNSVSL